MVLGAGESCSSRFSSFSDIMLTGQHKNVTKGKKTTLNLLFQMCTWMHKLGRVQSKNSDMEFGVFKVLLGNQPSKKLHVRPAHSPMCATSTSRLHTFPTWSFDMEFLVVRIFVLENIVRRHISTTTINNACVTTTTSVCLLLPSSHYHRNVYQKTKRFVTGITKFVCFAETPSGFKQQQLHSRWCCHLQQQQRH